VEKEKICSDGEFVSLDDSDRVSFSSRAATRVQSSKNQKWNRAHETNEDLIEQKLEDLCRFSINIVVLL